MSPWAIETRELTKAFGRMKAIEEVSLQIPAGSVVGLLGPNGAGKSTLIRLLMGHLHATSGVVRMLGVNPWDHPPALLRRVAYVSQTMALPGWMTVTQALKLNREWFPAWNQVLAEELLDEFELRGRGRFDRLSVGQQRKLLILLALAQSPDLLILDEPAASLDVETRQAFLGRILDLACHGDKTVVVSSHLLSDVERMADYIVLLRGGHKVMEGGLDDLKSRVRQLQILADVPELVLREHFDVVTVKQPALNETLVTVSNYSDERVARFVSTLSRPDLMRVHRLNLEQLYLELKA